MGETRKTLFDPIVSQDKLHPLFEHIRTSPASEPARWMLDNVYQSFEDPEGNFLEQFQTKGYDARHFELYLFAYFSRSGFVVDRTEPNPDFLISRNGISAAIEATTANPSTSGELAKHGKKIAELTEADMLHYRQHELPMRFGGPLFSKVNRKHKYWDLEHCKDLPFLLAIEAFHDENSLGISDEPLIRFLFGIEHTGTWDREGRLNIETATIKEHTIGNKTIPSGFFGQSETEHVSAVLFSNSGTNPKFARMGYQYGKGCDSIDMARVGFCVNRHPDAKDPTFFSYNLDNPPFVESWGQGLVALHNPNARHPLPKEFFSDVTQGYIECGVLKFEHPDWHPIASTTLILHLGEIKSKLLSLPTRRFQRLAVAAITKEQFQEACGFAVAESNPMVEEQGWFMDETESFIGVVLRDKADDDWGYVILGRDELFTFRPIKMQASLPARDLARKELQNTIADLLSRPQRIFP